MLARSNRLAKPRDIARVFKTGRFGGGELLTVKVAPNHLPHSRLTIVVSKKVSKKATTRNHNRRRISGAVEQLWKTVATGYDIVISVRQDLADAPANTVATELRQGLERAGALTATA
jgi:ribonuclease P protein component